MKHLYTTWLFFLLFLGWQCGYSQCGGINFSADLLNACAPASVKFSASGYPAGSKFSWDFGSGFTASAPADSVKFNLFKNTGTFSISLKVDIGGGTICTINKANYINVGAGPQLNVYWDKKTLCDSTLSVTFIDSTLSVVSRDWIIDGVSYKNGPATKTVKFASAGIKQLTLKVQTNLGCVAILNQDTAVIVVDNPNLSIDSAGLGGCLPVSNTFNPIFNTKYQTPTQWQWTFSGGSPATSSQQSPTVAYSNSGLYDVELTMTTNTGCKYTVKKQSFVEVVSRPTITLKANGSVFCNTDVIKLTNTTPGNNPGTFSWGLPGNANLISSNNDSTLFKIPTRGSYDISFHYNHKNCQSDTNYKNLLKINQTTAFCKVDEPNHCIVPSTVTITDSGSSVDPGFTYTRMFYVLDAGGQVLDSSSNGTFSHTFTKKGFYTIKLVVTGTNGCSDTLVQKDLIKIEDPRPKFSINPSIPCPFTLTEFADATPIYCPSKFKRFWQWELYDRDFTTLLATDTNEKWKYFFIDTGMYKVILRVYNIQGCIDSLIDTQTVHVTGISIQVAITKTKYCLGENVTATATVYPIQANPTFDWAVFSTTDTFRVTGGGAGLSIPVNKTGLYSVSCVAINQNCTATVFKKDTLRVGGIQYTGQVDSFLSCNPPRIFVSASKNYNIPTSSDTNVSFVWITSPANAVFTNQNGDTSHIEFTQDGFYTVAYSATNSDGCESSGTVLNNHWFGRSAKFDLDSIICVFDSIQVTDLSSTVNSYQWSVSGVNNFEIKPSASAASPWFTFKDTGMAVVRLVTQNVNGCADTFEKVIHVTLLKADFYSEDTLAYCGPVIVNFQYTGTPANSYVWDFGDGSPPYNTTSSGISHLYDIRNGSNMFKVSVRAQNKSGCYDISTKDRYVTLIGPIPYFTADTNRGCEPLQITFTNKSRGGKVVFFYDDKGNLDSTNSPTFSVTYKNKDTGNLSSAYFPYMVSIDSSGGCVKAFTLTDSVIVLAKPQANFTYSDTIFCQNTPVTFTNLSTYYTAINWDVDGDGFDDGTAQQFQHTFTSGFKFPAIVAVNKTGCYDTLHGGTMYAIPPKDVTLTATPKISCQGDTVAITAVIDTVNMPGLSFRWYLFENGQWNDLGNGSTLKYMAVNPGWYRISLVIFDPEGCVDSLQFDSVFRVKGNVPPIGSHLQVVTVDNDKHLAVKWDKCPSVYFTDYSLFRSLPGQAEQLVFKDTDANTLGYTDSQGVNIHTQAYSYKIVASELCVLPKIFEPHNSILLQAEKQGVNVVKLRWNHYAAWKGHVLYMLQRSNNNGLTYRKVLETTDTVAIDPKVCDSNYTYRILARDVSGQQVSTSNTARIRPDFVYLKDRSHIRSVSVEDNDRFVIKYDTTLFQFRTERYHLLQRDPPYHFWKRVQSNASDTAVKYPAKYQQISHFAVVREDFCHYLSDTGIWGRNIYLQAKLFGDSALLNWNSYLRPLQGVKHYVLQQLDHNTGLYKTLAILPPKDSSYFDTRRRDLFEEAMCYRVAAITRDYPLDTSYSNQACVVLPPMVFIPNSFTPNNDNKNEKFRPVISYVWGVKPVSGEKEYTFAIYNRWGERIYLTHDPREGWDGTYLGNEVSPGVYGYVVYAMPYNSDTPIKRSGWVMLMR